MIIKFTKGTYNVPEEQILNTFPKQFVTDKIKSTPDFIKENMDYFYSIAIARYSKNERTFAKNYDFVKGEVTKEDFWDEDTTGESFADALDGMNMPQDKLPAYVQFYSILANPLNTMQGEMSKRPDNTYVRAMDDDSQNEELQYRTDILQQYILEQAKQQILAKNADATDDQVQQMSEEQVKNYLTNYTSEAEAWGSHMLEWLKVRLSLREKSGKGFLDLLITAREFFHIYEDNTPLGYNVEQVNPKNVWFLNTPDQTYVSDPLDPSNGAYAAGTIELMEISEILNKFQLTQDEVQNLYNFSQQAYLLSGKESNLFNTSKTGMDSINYNTYDPAVMQYRLQAEAALSTGENELKDFLGISDSAGAFGNKFAVVRAYWCSKKKVGKLTYINQDNQETIDLVDENYKNNSHPNQISIEWGWTNQWYQGVKIGAEIYYSSPFNLFDYCPILGVTGFEGRNTTPKSMVDLLKPHQTLYNIFMNKLYESIQKDMGKVYTPNLRHIPVAKDGDPAEAYEQWVARAKADGMLPLDDSPENMKGPSSYNQMSVQDLSRVQEMQGYYNMAQQIKNEAWELVGISKQRMGNVQATETATGTNTALSQSYAQTEPWFTQHEYVMNKVYQAILDATMTIESEKPESSVRYIDNDGQKQFIRINGNQLKLKELGVLVTSRAEDARAFQELRQLSQAMLQNGATPYDIAILYSTKSMRQMKDSFKRLKDEAQQMQQQQSQQKQQELDQQNAQVQQAQQLAQQQHQADQDWESMQKQLDRLSKEKIAVISSLGYGKVQGEDANGNGTPDALETANFGLDQQKAQSDYQTKLKDIELKETQIRNQMQQHQSSMNLENKKLDVEKQRTAAQIQIAKIGAKNKPKK